MGKGRKKELLDLLSFKLVSLDMDKPESLDNAFKGVDRLFLLSPLTPDMVKQAKTVADAAKKVCIT